MRVPSMKQAEWIFARLEGYKESADDVYDVLLGNITSPADFVADVKVLALEYEEDFRRGNARAN